MKRLIALILVFASLMTLLTSAFADSGNTVTLNGAIYLMEKVGPSVDGPIQITKAVLRCGGSDKDVYLVLLSGIKSVIFNPTNLPSALTTLISAPSPYLDRLTALCLAKIPRGSKIIFAAHSLGGMVAQLFAANPLMKARYEILNITAFGSPLVNTIGREGTLHRLIDVSDPLYHYSITGYRNYLCYTSYEDGGYFPLSADAHTESYYREDIWGKYDCLGIKGGDAVISYNPADVYTYPWIVPPIKF